MTRRGRLLAAALSLAAHILVLLAFFWVWPDAPRMVEEAAVSVDLIAPPGPAPKAASPAPAAPAAPAKVKPAEKPPPRRPVVRPPPPDVDYLPTQVAKKSDTGSTLTEAQLAGAATAGSGVGAGGGAGGGGGGGACNMVARLQAALRKDPMVRAAIAGSGGRATLVWNGDWVRDFSEDGKGLAIIREAIMWEVAFAPAACKAQPVRGMVVLSVAGAGAPTRLALGGGSWRWSDLLTPHPGAGGASDQ
ncbi:MAG TPA: hypothetical protein VKQ54_17110 [Caulobacteraceae bacterium]|nr:hypothetical protein [Caulobacteraceae bacterium]